MTEPKVVAESIHFKDKVRVQTIQFGDDLYSILCNDRFDEGDFTIKVYCEICGPEKFVPKVLEYHGHHICNSCLCNFNKMINAATLLDCSRDRDYKDMLQRKLKEIEQYGNP